VKLCRQSTIQLEQTVVDDDADVIRQLAIGIIEDVAKGWVVGGKPVQHVADGGPLDDLAFQDDTSCTLPVKRATEPR
jgi:hypothetical protein